MKNAIKTIILTLIMFALLICIIGVAIFIFFEINSSSTDVVYQFVGKADESSEIVSNSVTNKTNDLSLQEKIKEIFVIEDTPSYNYSSKNSESNYYYKQLNEYEKKIYNGLQENKENLKTGNYVINYGAMFSEVLGKEDGTKILGDYYQTALEAFTHDNMDVFYLNINKMYLNMESTKKITGTTYNAYITSGSNSNYYVDGFSSKEEINTALEQIDEIVNNIKKKLTSNEQKNIRYVHDYIIDNCEYDQTYSAKGSYSIYGTLIGKTSVCEGYAKTLKYLLNKIGIQCELIQGKGINNNGKTENHAWNAVYLDNKWYLIDSTWDDPIIIGGGLLNTKSRYRYYLKGINTFYEDHQPENIFSEGGKSFEYPNISKTDY